MNHKIMNRKLLTRRIWYLIWVENIPQMLCTNGLVTSLWLYWKVPKSLECALEDDTEIFSPATVWWAALLCCVTPSPQQDILPCVGPEQPGQMAVDRDFWDHRPKSVFPCSSGSSRGFCLQKLAAALFVACTDPDLLGNRTRLLLELHVLIRFCLPREWFSIKLCLIKYFLFTPSHPASTQPSMERAFSALYKLTWGSVLGAVVFTKTVSLSSPTHFRFAVLIKWFVSNANVDWGGTRGIQTGVSSLLPLHPIPSSHICIISQ